MKKDKIQIPKGYEKMSEDIESLVSAVRTSPIESMRVFPDFSEKYLEKRRRDYVADFNLTFLFFLTHPDFFSNYERLVSEERHKSFVENNLPIFVVTTDLVKELKYKYSVKRVFNFLDRVYKYYHRKNKEDLREDKNQVILDYIYAAIFPVGGGFLKYRVLEEDFSPELSIKDYKIKRYHDFYKKHFEGKL